MDKCEYLCVNVCSFDGLTPCNGYGCYCPKRELNNAVKQLQAITGERDRLQTENNIMKKELKDLGCMYLKGVNLALEGQDGD